MGRAKEEWTRQCELGYSSVGEKFVCPECFEDYAIRAFIEAHASSEVCSYCGKNDDQPIAAHMDDVLPFLAEGINFEWNMPEAELPYETREGGWQGQVYDGQELIETIDIRTNSDDLFEDICDSFDEQLWCQRDYFGTRDEDALRYGWKGFCEQIKHQSRYVFFRIDDAPDECDHETIPASKMLDVLAGVIEKRGLVSVIPSGRSIYRTRIHDQAESPSSASELGSPQVDKCSFSNRMSPAGIPMFYGASDPKTAILETYEDTIEEKQATCGEFKTSRELRVLDLTDLPGIPSLFDEDKRHLRPATIFLQGFVDDVSKPIHKDGKEHIEYVPTQALAEYFRHLYRDEEDNALDGIMFRSSRNPDGANYVLFAENEHFCDKGGESPSKFMAVEPWLVLESIEAFDPAKVSKEHEDDLRSKPRGLLGRLE